MSGIFTDNIDNLDFVENDDQINVYWHDNDQVYECCLTEKSDINFMKHAKEQFLTKFIRDTHSFRLEFYIRVGDELLKFKGYKMTLREKSEVDVLRDQVASLKKVISDLVDEKRLISIKFSNILFGTHNPRSCQRSYNHKFLYKLENKKLRLVGRKTSLNNFSSVRCDNPSLCSYDSYSTEPIKSELFVQKIADEFFSFSYGLYSRCCVVSKSYVKMDDYYRLDFDSEWIAINGDSLIVRLKHKKEGDIIKTIPIKNGKYVLNFCTIKISNGAVVV